MNSFRMAVQTSLIGLATGVALPGPREARGPAKRLHSLGEAFVAGCRSERHE